MSNYTEEDFKKATFARHAEGGYAAMKYLDDSKYPWSTTIGAGSRRSDSEMALAGWVPVVEEGQPFMSDASFDDIRKGDTVRMTRWSLGAETTVSGRAYILTGCGLEWRTQQGLTLAAQFWTFPHRIDILYRPAPESQLPMEPGSLIVVDEAKDERRDVPAGTALILDPTGEVWLEIGSADHKCRPSEIVSWRPAKVVEDNE